MGNKNDFYLDSSAFISYDEEHIRIIGKVNYIQVKKSDESQHDQYENHWIGID